MPTAATIRRRRLTALGVLALLAIIGVVLLAHGGGSSTSTPQTAATPKPKQTATAKPKALAQLPRGGRTILPRYRVVAYYGAPQDKGLGELGIGTPARAAAKLAKQAAPYARKSRPVMPAMELIAVVAAGAPGDGGRYNLRQPDSVIRRYLDAARKDKALLILDIQPGRSDFFTEAIRLRKWLKYPDVSLALDPEWRMGPDQIPGKVIGRVGAREVNATTAWLSQLTTKYRLPQKLLLIHEFTDFMVPEAQLKPRPNLATVLNVDGFGTQALKIAKYKDFTKRDTGFRHGFKLFYHEDTNTMTPGQTMKLNPRPDVIVYE